MLSLYDAFTVTPILFLEDLGFCAKGEGGPFVAGEAIAPGGRLAVAPAAAACPITTRACTGCWR